MNRSPRERGRAATLFLVTAVGAAAALVWLRPWSGHTKDEARLRERVAEYADARRKGDVDALFRLVVPSEAETVGLDAFRRFYRQDLTRLHGVTVLAVQLDADKGRATTELDVDYELLRENLPANFARNLQTQGGALRQQGKVMLDWLWSDGDWHFRLDRVVMTGRDKDGRPAAATQPPR